MLKQFFPLALIFPLIIGPMKTSSFLDIPNGGKIQFDFSSQEDLNLFQYYQSRSGIKPFNNGDRLYTWNMAEQKIILNDYQFTTIYASVKLGQITKGTWMQSGFYVQANNVTNLQDGLSGYNVNIEKDKDRDYYFLRLHFFDDGKWKGIIKEIVFHNEYDEIELSMSVKDGLLKTCVNNNTNYSFTYNIGTKPGYFGLRSYYSPMYFRDLTIIAPDFNKDYTELEKLLHQIETLDYNVYTVKSITPLINYYQEIIDNDYRNDNQINIDRHVQKINKLLSRLVKKISFEELQKLIEDFSSIENNNTYTKNSWKSFVYCLEKCQELTSDSSEDEISYWGNMLISRKNELIKYGDKV